MHRYRLAIFCLLAAAAACAPQSVTSPADNAARSRVIAAADDSLLCAEHLISADLVTTMMVEAELALRGVTRCSDSHVGQATGKSVGKRLYARRPGDASGDVCAGFASEAAAQKAYLALGGPVDDPSALDPDGDGNACGWGAELRRIAESHAPASTERKQARAARDYLRGPRGGCYYLTAGGKRYVSRDLC